MLKNKKILLGAILYSFTLFTAYISDELVHGNIKRKLCDAISNDDLPSVKQILKKHKLANETNPEGESMLSLAIQKKSPEVVKELLRAGANVSDSTYLNQVLISWRNFEFFKVHRDVPTDIVAAENLKEIAKLLLHYGAENQRFKNGKFMEATNALCDTLNFFDGRTLLLAFRDLLISKANVCAEDNEMECSEEMITMIESGLNGIETAEELLIKAVGKQDVETINNLIRSGTNVNCKTEKADITPLHVAAKYNAIYSIIALISNGANVNAKDSLGRTPLHYAAKIVNKLDPDDSRAANLLIQGGADLYAQDYYGNTPRDHALKFGAKFTVKLIDEKTTSLCKQVSEDFDLPEDVAKIVMEYLTLSCYKK